jgi:ATP-dependent DNA helicase DinG
VGEQLSLRREGQARLTETTFDPLATPVRSVLASLAALSSFAANAEEPEVLTLGRRSAEIANDLEFVTRADSSDHVYWAEGRGRGVFLRAAPIEIAEALRKTLYAQVDTVVFTSATLRADGRFDFFRQRMGLAGPGDDLPPLEKLAVKSSFDYPNQAALYLPAHLPEPNAPGFVEAVVEEVLALCEITGGRAFALFTSVRNMEAAHALARDRLAYPVYLQGERPKAVLLELFKQAPSVLFATHSFWEGVDVPGDALSLVVIDKLPFASPQDPLVAARVSRLEKMGQEPFSAYQVPQAAIALQQGFGRLIRTRQDRGIVAILDRRMTTKGYGRAFLRSLPPARRVMNQEALRRFFRGEG